MITPLNSTLSNLSSILVRTPELTRPAPTEDTQLTVPPPVTSLSAADSSAALAAPAFSATALKLRFDTSTRFSEHGEGGLETRSKLRFQYTFQSSDGTGIKIDAKIKLKESYSQSEGDGGLSQQLKFKAKFHIEVIQQDVAESGQQLASAPQIPDQAKAVIRDALALFGEISDSLLNSVQQGEAVDGGALISGIVEAFNALSQSVLGATEAAGPGLASDPPAELPPAVLPPAELPPIESLPPIEPAATGPAAPILVEPALQSPTPVVATTAGPTDSGPVSSPTTDVAQVDAQTPADAADVEAGNEAAEVGEVEDGEDQPHDAAAITRQTLLKLRLQFVQSLDQLATSFGQDNSDTAPSQSVVRSESRFRLDLSYLQLTTTNLSAGALVDETA